MKSLTQYLNETIKKNQLIIKNDDLENYSKPWILGTLTNVSIENL